MQRQFRVLCTVDLGRLICHKTICRDGSSFLTWQQGPARPRWTLLPRQKGTSVATNCLVTYQPPEIHRTQYAELSLHSLLLERDVSLASLPRDTNVRSSAY